MPKFWSGTGAQDLGADADMCASEAGLVERRAWGLALVTGGVVFLVGVYMTRTPDQRKQRAPRWTVANRAAPGLRKAEEASTPAEPDASP